MVLVIRVLGFVAVVATIVAGSLQPAEARRDVIKHAGECFIISSSFHGTSPEKALRQAQRDLEIAIRRISRREGWRNGRVQPWRVPPNPTLRTEVTPDVMLKPDVKTTRSYSQCWTGVIWAYVCTSGAKLCPR